MRLKAFLWLVFLFAVAQGAWAEQVTEEQAQQQAQKFLTNLSPTSGVRHAPGTMPQFTTIRQVSGLYVFNLDGGGFVIVSNDDRTIPVLGYGNTGSIDPDDMPATTFDWANMKDSYSENDYTADEANAVATLMQYCGHAVWMDYGSASVSYMTWAALALKEYFDDNISGDGSE